MSADLLIKEVQLLRRELRYLKKQQQKQTWVTVSTITELTIWNTKEKLRRAREHGLVEVRRSEEGIRYKLESINQMFFKSK